MLIPIIPDQKPILVVVANGRWDAYAQSTLPSPSDTALLAILKEMGGVNESVTPGHYHFNAKPLPNGDVEVSLNPVTE